MIRIRVARSGRSGTDLPESPAAAINLLAVRLAPAKPWSDGREDRLQDMYVIAYAQLIRNGEQDCVRFSDCLILLELFDQKVWLCGIASPEDGSRGGVKKANLICLLSLAPEVGSIEIVH